MLSGFTNGVSGWSIWEIFFKYSNLICGSSILSINSKIICSDLVKIFIVFLHEQKSLLLQWHNSIPSSLEFSKQELSEEFSIWKISLSEALSSK